MLPNRIINELSQAIYRNMPRQATLEQKQSVDHAARAVVEKHFDKLCTELAELDTVIDAKCQALTALQAVNELLYAALKQVEWIQDYEEGDWYCSGCDMNKLIGHDDSCELKLALDAARPQAAKPATEA